VILLSGDDADAKSRVIALFEDSGYSTIDLCDLAMGGRMQQAHGPLAGVNLIRVLD
jgi:predicted dinucleotide-binding enzyme